eukprot:5147666-Prymnesium_polylepis.1
MRWSHAGATRRLPLKLRWRTTPASTRPTRTTPDVQLGRPPSRLHSPCPVHVYALDIPPLRWVAPPMTAPLL